MSNKDRVLPVTEKEAAGEETTPEEATGQQNDQDVETSGEEIFEETAKELTPDEMIAVINVIYRKIIGADRVQFSDIKEADLNLLAALNLYTGNRPDILRSFVLAATDIDEITHSFFRGLSTAAINDIDYLDRKKVSNIPSRIIYEALERISYDKLHSEEKDLYIKSMVEAHGIHYSKHYRGYYYLGWSWPSLSKENMRGDSLLREVVLENPAKVLTDEELEAVYEAEKNTFKIHLNVPPERKIEVLKAILTAQQEDQQIREQILQSKKEAGEEISASSEEVRARGGKLTSLNEYKMSEFGLDDPDFALNPDFADFVFYPVGNSNRTGKEAMMQMVHEINNVLADLGLPPVDRVPRFSTPVIINEEEVPGLTFVQGNGDFKAYLSRQYGLDKLKQYYDEERNFAVRPGEEYGFDGE